MFSHSSHSYLEFLGMLPTYLKSGVKEGMGDRYSILTPRMPTARPWPGWSQKPRTPLECPTGMAEVHPLLPDRSVCRKLVRSRDSLGLQSDTWIKDAGVLRGNLAYHAQSMLSTWKYLILYLITQHHVTTKLFELQDRKVLICLIGTVWLCLFASICIYTVPLIHI